MYVFVSKWENNPNRRGFGSVTLAVRQCVWTPSDEKYLHPSVFLWDPIIPGLREHKNGLAVSEVFESNGLLIDRSKTNNAPTDWEPRKLKNYANLMLISFNQALIYEYLKFFEYTFYMFGFFAVKNPNTGLLLISKRPFSAGGAESVRFHRIVCWWSRGANQIEWFNLICFKKRLR